MIKAIFFDVDGTLVSFLTHKIPQSTINSIVRLKEKGIKVFIATGRHQSALNNLGDLEFDGFITINGGYCALSDGTKIHQCSIDKSDVNTMIELIKKLDFPTMVVDEKGFFINYYNDIVHNVLDMLKFPNIPTASLNKTEDMDVLQFVSFFPLEQDSEIMSQLPNCESTRWYPLFTDIIPKGSSKAIGIEKMLDYFGLTAKECMAFGDGSNDIEMLQYVGVGVAMGNATDNVKQHANYITDTVDEDGVEKALRKYGVI